MILAFSERSESYMQFITILILFVFVLFLTWGVTRWIAGYQKGKGMNANMDIVETMRLANNKYLQIVRVGEKYFAIAVCKDSVTLISEIAKDDICFPQAETSFNFQDVLAKVQKKNLQQRKEEREDEEN